MAEVQSGDADFKAILVYDVSRWGRFQDADEGAYHEHVCWDVFLNVLNVETEDGATGAHLRRVLFGEPEMGPLPRYDEVMGQLYIQVLRPLCWAGLLQQERGHPSYRFEDAVFMKTPLWRAALRLETDDVLGRAIRH